MRRLLVKAAQLRTRSALCTIEEIAHGHFGTPHEAASTHFVKYRLVKQTILESG
jgi:hypothetical protein